MDCRDRMWQKHIRKTARPRRRVLRVPQRFQVGRSARPRRSRSAHYWKTARRSAAFREIFHLLASDVLKRLGLRLLSALLREEQSRRILTADYRSRRESGYA